MWIITVIPSFTGSALYKNLLDPAADVQKELVVGNKSGPANLLLYSPLVST